MIQAAEQKASQGAYLEAARLYTAAYEMRPDPVLLKNAAVTLFAAERCPDAEREAKRYLAAAPLDAPELDRTDARAVLVRCRLQIADEALAAGDPDAAARAVAQAEAFEPAPAEATRIEALRARIDAASTSPASPAPTPVVDAPVPPEVSPTPDPLIASEVDDSGAPGWVAPTGYALLGVGALGVGAVIVRGVLWNSAIESVQNDYRFDLSRLSADPKLTPDACVGPDADECRDVLDKDGFLTSQIVFGSIAGAVLATGAALTIWSWSDDGDEAELVRVDAWGQGARVSVRF